MDEVKYRESRVCRLLGTPVVYQLVLFLESGDPLTPSKLAKIARAVSSNRERASRQIAGRRLGPLRHGWEAGSLLAEAQAGHKQTSQGPGNHRPFIEQTYPMR